MIALRRAGIRLRRRAKVYSTQSKSHVVALGPVPHGGRRRELGLYLRRLGDRFRWHGQQHPKAVRCYAAAGAGAAVGPGGGVIVLTNQNGAVLALSGRQIGLIVAADLNGLVISLR